MNIVAKEDEILRQAEAIRQERAKAAWNPRVKGPYSIMINERQRKLLERAIRFLRRGAPIVTKKDQEELDLLDGMLTNLPKEDAPGTLHGFCL